MKPDVHGTSTSGMVISMLWLVALSLKQTNVDVRRTTVHSFFIRSAQMRLRLGAALYQSAPLN
jgi:hypothetical protein